MVDVPSTHIPVMATPRAPESPGKWATAASATPCGPAASPTEIQAFRLDSAEAVLTTVEQQEQLLVIRLWRPGKGITVTKRS